MSNWPDIYQSVIEPGLQQDTEGHVYSALPSRQGTAQLVPDIGFSCRCAGTLPLIPPSKDGNIVSSVSSSVSVGSEVQGECPGPGLPAGLRFPAPPESQSPRMLSLHLSLCTGHSGWVFPRLPPLSTDPCHLFCSPLTTGRPGFSPSPMPLLTATSLPSLQVLLPQLEAPALLGRKLP